MRAMIKRIGERVTLTLKNDSIALKGPFASGESDTYQLQGTVLDPRHSGCYREPDMDLFFFGVPHTEVPIRVIDIKQVIAINGVQLIQSKHKPQEFNIKSSKGDVNYKVIKREGRWTCSCSAFGFRGACRHIEEAKNQ